MPAQALIPQAAAESYRRRQSMTLATILAVRALWRQLSGNWGDSWAQSVGPRVAAVVTAGQVAVAREADSYVPNVLVELGLAAGVSTFNPLSVAGVASDGGPLDVWLGGAVVKAGQSYERLRTTPEAVLSRTPPPGAAREALADGQRWMDQIVSTLLADATRAAESVAIAERPWVDGYVRMLNVPSCSRCVLLAGKFYLWNDGFNRHPGCDCTHIPASEEGKRFGSLVTNPNTYFDSLSDAEQDKAFTKAGAQAVRDGADISQVVNARRGMSRAQVYGHDVLVTNVGTTKRGSFGRLEGQRGGQFAGTNVGRRGAVKNYVERRTQRVRLMPEAIYQIADGDRAEAVRLLRVYGFLT